MKFSAHGDDNMISQTLYNTLQDLQIMILVNVSPVGDCVGDTVGSSVGVSVGFSVGCWVGSSLGCSVGL